MTNEKTEKKEFYLSTIDQENDYLIYQSKPFKLTELDILNLIRLCLVERRSKRIGRKFLKVYRDSTEHRKELTRKRLNEIGVETNEREPKKEEEKNCKEK
jgi:hypothetical protein